MNGPSDGDGLACKSQYNYLIHRLNSLHEYGGVETWHGLSFYSTGKLWL